MNKVGILYLNESQGDRFWVREVGGTCPGLCLKEEVGVELKPRDPNVDGLAQVIWSDETEEREEPTGS
jgi:hypothetical protein